MTSPSTQGPNLANLPEGLSPDCLDTIAVLSSILSRVQAPQGNEGSPPAGSPPNKEALLNHGPITLAQVPLAADDIKSKLQKARTQVKTLPDMKRGLSAQEQEIRDLEAKIEKQRAALVKLKEAGVRIKGGRERRDKSGED